MKADKVVMGSNSNPFYLDFWPIVSKIWKLKFKIEPVLFFIHDDPSVVVSEEYGTVHYIKPVEGVPVSLQCQWVRYWAPMTDLDATWMISDIDMLPISRSYFKTSIEAIPDDKFVNLNSPSIAENPACYNVAKGHTFKKVLELPDSFEESLKRTKYWEVEFEHVVGDGYGKNVSCFHWVTDESYSNRMIKKYHEQVDSSMFVNPERPGGFCARRVDRIGFWDVHSDEQILSESLLDAHCPRPYLEYKESIDRLVNLILERV
jgi:hypothetical protein